MKRIISFLLLFAIMCLVCSCGDNGSESSEKTASWPNKTITVICPYSAGGAADMMSRTICDKLSERLGVSCVVNIVSGA